MTAAEQQTGSTRLPDAVLRGPAVEDPTVAIPVQRPVADPYGPPAGLGPLPGGGPAFVHGAPLPGHGPVHGAPGLPGHPPYGRYPAPRRRTGVVVGGIAAGVTALGLVVAVAGAASSIDVEGTFTLTDSYSSYWGSGVGSFTPGRSCEGDGGYSDIQAGTAVTISDAAGRVVAAGVLAGGRASSSADCDFTFSVPDVPGGEDLYRLEVSHRGTLTYTADQLAAGPVVTLGD
jgi:hypothetical protein